MEDISTVHKETIFSPKQFMKARRPERFSDSVHIEVGALDRVHLEYQMSILNKKSKELAFEEFAKALCEKTICPNLLAQTGPVAGGDGKVDTQTFPVSEQLQLRWFVGVNESSNSERWAFAVSTQERWKQKCKADIRKIVGTERGYKKGFYITNQLIKSDQRSAVEDELKEETGLDVRILDCTWILDQVFSLGLESMAIAELGIETDWRREIKTGTADYAREIRLKELETGIQNEFDYTNISHHEVDCFLEAAETSKELERPEADTRGRFDRAVKISEKFGTTFQKFKIHYRYAWAAYWWFEDFETFRDEFLLCLKIGEELDHASEWGDIVTLYGLYSGALRFRGEGSTEEIETLRQKIRSNLDALIACDQRPSNSLMAEAHAQIMNLHFAQSGTEGASSLESVFSELLNIFKRGEKLIGFTHSDLYSLIIEIDEYVGDCQSYEQLLDYVTDSSAKREGKSSASKILVKRGAKRLEARRPYEAIKLLGKSLTGLYQKGCEVELYAALNLIAKAYIDVSLYWSARSSLLLASTIVTNEYWSSGEVRSGQVHSYMRLARQELLLGRVYPALAWFHLATQLSKKFDTDMISEDEIRYFDAALGHLMVNGKLDDISNLSGLPDWLSANELVAGEFGLLYSLGYENELLEIMEEDKAGLQNFFLLVRDVEFDFAHRPMLSLESRYAYMGTVVMGCEVQVGFPNRTPFIELAETMLAAIESIFATLVVDGGTIFERRLFIEVSADDDEDVSINHEVRDSGSDLSVEVMCSSFSHEKLNMEGQGKIQSWIRGFLIDVLLRLIKARNHSDILEKMFEEDEALQRSVPFSSSFMALRNVFGDDASSSMMEFFRGDEFRDFPLIREEKWDIGLPPKKESSRVASELDSPTEKGIHLESLKHSDYKNLGLINVRLWDKASWRGTVFMTSDGAAPVLAILFEEPAHARSIFEELVAEIGEDDPNDQLRISVIKGVSEREPNKYRMLISENIHSKNQGKMVTLSSRINTMTPSTPENLERFLSSYKKSGKFLLTFTHVSKTSGTPAPPTWDKGTC